MKSVRNNQGTQFLKCSIEELQLINYCLNWFESHYQGNMSLKFETMLHQVITETVLASSDEQRYQRELKLERLARTLFVGDFLNVDPELW